VASVTRTDTRPLQGGVGYQLTDTEEWAPEAVEANFDGTSAAGPFLACLSLYSPGGALISRSFPYDAIAAGDVAKVTYAPFLRKRARAATAAYETIEDEGVALAQERTLNFTGAGVTATDDAPNARTNVTIPGGGSGGGDGCRIYRSTAQTVTNNNTETLSFDTELYDAGGMFDPIGNPTQIVCQTAGRYLLGGNVFYDVNAIGYRGLQIFTTGLGGAVIALEYAPSAGAVIGTGMNLHTVIDLAVGDALELRVRQTSGGNLDVRNLVYYSPQFWAQRLA
jgi:hypothetical protein